jgi:hypothetical protein
MNQWEAVPSRTLLRRLSCQIVAKEFTGNFFMSEKRCPLLFSIQLINMKSSKRYYSAT